MFTMRSPQNVLASVPSVGTGAQLTSSFSSAGINLPQHPPRIPGSLFVEEMVYEHSDTGIAASTEIDELAEELEVLPGLGVNANNSENNVGEDTPTPHEGREQSDIISNFNEPAYSNSHASEFVDDVKFPPGLYPVAFSPIHQQYFEEYGTAWGVQWQIARIATTYPSFGWKNISEEMVFALCGPNLDKAPQAPRILFSNAPQFLEYAQQEALTVVPEVASPWSSYDEEESYIRREQGSTDTNDNGGKIIQRIYLRIDTRSKTRFKFTLEQPTKSKSFRFNRFLGSRRVIQCHFSEKDRRSFGSEILDFFASNKLLILGRLYQGFYGHDSKIELMEINEDFGRTPTDLYGDHNRMSLLDFIAWHNNVELNGNQTVGKWGSRFALGFSTSLVGVTFDHTNIHFLDDIYAPGTGSTSAAAHEIMSDGCGFINRSALKAIQTKMGWEVFPVHVQARIAGAKGLFILHPEHQHPNEPPQIWIRSSQRKVKLQSTDKWSPFHYILDICSGPFIQSPSSIGYEMILCLSQDGEGVPQEVFIERLQQSLKDIASVYEPSDHHHASHVLWDSVYSMHRVQQNMLRRILPPEQQRAHGFLSYDDEDEGDHDDTVSAKWDVGPDEHSGMPATSQEQVLGWLQAGFDATDPWVMEKLAYLLEKRLNAAIKKFRITIPQSLRAHIIPDPLGVLDEGEIFFASSQTQLEDSTGTKKYCVTGPVIVSRNPCVQKSDVRKVNAVENHQLLSLGYCDVIIFSTKGECSLASLLSGGDYDGDTVVMIWDESITSQFINSDLSSARPSDSFESDNFNKSKQKLGDLVARLALRGESKEAALSRILLQGAVAKRLEGRYNVFYRNSVYLNGLDHPDTIRLGQMFTSCLDSTKSGLTVNPNVLTQDVRKWDRKPPECFARAREPEDESQRYKLGLRRDPDLPPFILDTLLRVADEEAEKYKMHLLVMRDEMFKSKRRDEDLILPFEDAQARARRHGFTDELQLILDHVDQHRTFFRQARGNQGPYSPRKLRGKSKHNQISIGDRQESARAVSEAYNSNMPVDLAHFDDAGIRRVAASYAYYLDRSFATPDYNFCFSVAWAELCALKARATGGDFTTLASGYMDSMSMNKKISKLYREEMGLD
ncbi:RNA-dependent RNA polymerase [Ceratobasidium sp. AG-Ba]|nr:RNA-dependent RNA polymerase [Ceratobasidium sp. AG-Ba]QRW13925.1 RNA-dependent RNA polymerase [Ceratobasidium sp. AG-Ba]